MSSAPAPHLPEPERSREQIPQPPPPSGNRLDMATLILAAVAGAVAALVTSWLVPSVAILSGALTPVIVAIVSEALRNPTRKVAAVTAKAPDVVAAVAPASIRGGWRRRARPHGRGAGGSPTGYRRYSLRRRFRWRPAIITGLLAAVLGALALTLPELLLGGAPASERRTTYFGGGSSSTWRP